jgi:hypothetical protein
MRGSAASRSAISMKSLNRRMNVSFGIAPDRGSAVLSCGLLAAQTNVCIETSLGNIQVQA